MTGVRSGRAAVPVGWQLNEGRVAGRDLKRIETQLVAGQSERASVQAESERLRELIGRVSSALEGSAVES